MSDPSNPFGALHSLRSASLSTTMKSPLTSSSTSSSETHNPFGGPVLNKNTSSASASALPLSNSSATTTPVPSSPMPPPKTLSDHVHDFLSGPQLACVCEQTTLQTSSSPPVPPLRLISLTGGGGGGGASGDKSSSARPLPTLLSTSVGQEVKPSLPRVSDVVKALRDHQYLRIVEAIPIAEECFSALAQTAAAQNAVSLGRGIALVQMRTLALISLKRASFAVADSSSAMKVLLSYLKSNQVNNSASSSSTSSSVDVSGVEALCLLLCTHGTALSLSGLWREAVTILHAVLRLASGIKPSVVVESSSKSVFSSWAAKGQSFSASESCPISEQVLAFLYSGACDSIISSLPLIKRARLVTLSSVRCSDSLHGAGYAMAAINALQEGVKGLKEMKDDDVNIVWLQRGILGCLLSNALKSAGKESDSEKAMGEALTALDRTTANTKTTKTLLVSSSEGVESGDEEMRLFASAYTSVLRAQALLVQTQQQQLQGQQQQQQQQQHFQALGLSETGLIAAAKALKLQQSRIDASISSSVSSSSTTTSSDLDHQLKDTIDEAISSSFGCLLSSFFSPAGSGCSGLPDSADVFIDACLVTAEALKRSSWASFSSAGGGAMMARPADVLLAAVRSFPSVCLEKPSFVVALIGHLEGNGVSATNALGGGGGGGGVVVAGGSVPRGAGSDAMSVAILKRVLFSVGQRSGLVVDEGKFRLGGIGGGQI